MRTGNIAYFAPSVLGLVDGRPFGMVSSAEYPTINAAIDAVHDSGGGTVIIPDGVHLRSANGNPIILKSGVSLVSPGGNAVFHNDGTSTSQRSVVAAGSLDAETNLAADVPGGVNAGFWPFEVQVDDASIFEIGDDVQMYDGDKKEFNVVVGVDTDTNIVTVGARPAYDYAVSDGAKLAKVTLVKNASIIGIRFTNASGVGGTVHLTYCKDIEIRGCVFESVHDSVYVQDSESVRIINNTMHDGVRAVTLDSDARLCTVQQNIIRRSRTGAVLSGHKNSVIGNQLFGIGDPTNGNGDGITVGGSGTDNLVEGNVIDAANCYGIWVTGVNPKRTIIVGNTVTAGITAGIYVNKGSDHVVAKNVLRLNSNGILVEGVDNCVIEGNATVANSNRGIYVLGSTTLGTQVLGNRAVGNGSTDIDLTNSDYNIAIGNNVRGGTANWGTGENNLIGDNLE